MEKVNRNGERREWKSGRGRKYGSGDLPPNKIVSYVNTLVERGEAKNVHDAFWEVSEVTGYEYDIIKKIYYNTLQRDKYRPLIETDVKEVGEEPINLKLHWKSLLLMVEVANEIS